MAGNGRARFVHDLLVRHGAGAGDFLLGHARCLHLAIGLTIFLLFPFTRLVHIWSGFASIFYLFRPYQLMRSRGGNR